MIFAGFDSNSVVTLRIELGTILNTGYSYIQDGKYTMIKILHHIFFL